MIKKGASAPFFVMKIEIFVSVFVFTISAADAIIK